MSLILSACLAALAIDPVALAADATVHPGDDFDAYANGAWLEATAVPAGSARWSVRNDISALTRRQLAALLDAAPGAAPGTDARKVADFRSASRDAAAIESQGLAPLRPLFERIDAVSDKAGLVRLLGSDLRADVDPLNAGTYDSAHLLGVSVTPGNQGEPANVVFLLQGGLGLGSRAPYVGDTTEARTRRASYQRYIRHVLELAGFDRATERADGVMSLETAIAHSHATAEVSADERNAGNLWTRDDFARRAPGMDWTGFLDAAGLLKQETFVAWQPGAIKGAAALVGSEPLATWLDYLRFHAIDLHAAVLPRAFADSYFAIHGSLRRDADATQEVMSGPIGRMYADRYFPPDQKARLAAMADSVITAFRARIEAVTWLSPSAKSMALAKMKTLYFGVGYPENWPNYSTLVVSPVDAVGNLQRLAAWNLQAALSRAGQPADRTEWRLPPQTVGAVLLFHQNAYNFPAALLQPTKYDPAASDAMNYGAIGAIIGHEVSHFVDTLGADYDAAGRRTHWWSAADMAGYQAVTAPLVRQFSDYVPVAGLHIDGKHTLVENVADLAGLAAAFDAYRRTLGSRANDRDFVRQQDREFFIGFARAWRTRYSDEGLRAQMSNDHAPERYRIATVRNLDAWYDAFDVRPGHALYLEPEARVRIW
jgi:putative endopeptidase